MSFTPSENPITNPTRESYTELRPFRFWCQKVLPLVYDNSLSYYELLCKVVDYLNKTMEDVDHMNTDIDTLYSNFQEFQEGTFRIYNELVDYVNAYFENLDVQEEINNKLDEMVTSGELVTILQPSIADEVADWLAEHITPTTPAIDDTLTVSGAAADAKAVGDRFTSTDKLISGNMYNIIEGFYSPKIGDIEIGGINASTGELQDNVARARTRFIPLHKSDRVGFTDFNGLYYMLIEYDYNGNFVSSSPWYTAQTTIQNTNYYRILFSISNVDNMAAYLDQIESAMYITYMTTDFVANALPISSSNYLYYLPDANNAEINKSYIIVLNDTTNRPANLPDVNDDTIVLITFSQAGSYAGASQIVICKNGLYKRNYASNQWSAWKQIAITLDEYYTFTQTYIYPVSYVNYIYTLPDLNTAPINKRFRIVRLGNEAGNTFPANIPVAWNELSDGIIISVVETYAENNNYQGGFQTLKNEFGLWVRHFSSGEWHEWVNITESNGRNKIVIDGQNLSFSQGIITAFNLGNCDVYVNKGTYNIKEEIESIYGANIWTTGYNSFQYFRGLPFGNGMHIIGSPGAKIVMDASNINNTSVWDEFSVLMNYTGAADDQKINIVENLKFDCTCIRYCIHFDLGTAEIDDEYIIKMCDLYLDNHANTMKTFAYCVGMGASVNTTFVIEDCYVYAVTPPNPRDTAYIYYHNTNAASPNNSLIVKNNYIDNGGTVRVDGYGESQNKCLVMINNNSLGSAIVYLYPTDNLNVVEWNNEIRTS